MTDTPPFNPPYRTITRTTTGLHIVETLVDGSTRVLGALAVTAVMREMQLDADACSTRVTKVPVKATGNQSAAIFLEVPFAEKDKAKSAGARWDAAKRKWYAPHGIDINQFKRWWPEDLKQNMA